MTDIHSCSYFCTRPACVLAQRDELRGRFLQQAERVDKWLTDDLPQVDKEQAEPVQADPVFDAMLDALTTGTGIMSGFKRIYPFEMLDIGCSVCGIGAGKVMGYVCQRGDCPSKVTCGGNPSW